jgi:hypothetical protein
LIRQLSELIDLKSFKALCFAVESLNAHLEGAGDDPSAGLAGSPGLEITDCLRIRAQTAGKLGLRHPPSIALLGDQKPIAGRLAGTASPPL